MTSEGMMKKFRRDSGSYPDLQDHKRDLLQPQCRSHSFELLPPDMSELRVVVLGNSWLQRSSVGNFILLEDKFSTEEEPHNCVRMSRQWNDQEVVLINTPDMLSFHISQHKQSEVIENCVRLSAPGPHVFLLVLQPEDFSEEHKKSLCKVLQLFSAQSFDHCLLLISTPREETLGFMEKYREEPIMKSMIRKCKHRYVWQKNLKHSELLNQLCQTAKASRGEHVSCDLLEGDDAGLTMKAEHMKPSLNLVLSGRRGAGKTSAAKAILGQKDINSVSNSSVCVRNQGEVCGRRISLVELPALYGKPLEEVMEESFRCVSLCDPEGVHAFILVLPEGPLTDEDKAELEIIQNIFGSGVNDFTMILLTVESDPAAPAVEDFIRANTAVQELCKSCGGRSVVLNIKDKQQVPELLDAVERMTFQGSRCFTKDMFTRVQMQKLVAFKAEEKLLKEKEDMKRKEEDIKRKHKEDVRVLEMKLKEAREKNKEERQLRVQQLKEKDQCIKTEQEKRKKEQEEAERKRKKQEDAQRQEWKKRQDDLEKMVQSERQQRENAEKKVEQLRRENKRDREAYDREKSIILERRTQEIKQNLEEEKSSHRKLQEEHQRKRRMWRIYLILSILLILVMLFLLYYIFLKDSLTAQSAAGR